MQKAQKIVVVTQEYPHLPDQDCHSGFVPFIRNLRASLPSKLKDVDGKLSVVLGSCFPTAGSRLVKFLLSQCIPNICLPDFSERGAP